MDGTHIRLGLLLVCMLCVGEVYGIQEKAAVHHAISRLAGGDVRMLDEVNRSTKTDSQRSGHEVGDALALAELNSEETSEDFGASALVAFLVLGAAALLAGGIKATGVVTAMYKAKNAEEAVRVYARTMCNEISETWRDALEHMVKLKASIKASIPKLSSKERPKAEACLLSLERAITKTFNSKACSFDKVVSASGVVWDDEKEDAYRAKLKEIGVDALKDVALAGAHFGLHGIADAVDQMMIEDFVEMAEDGAEASTNLVYGMGVQKARVPLDLVLSTSAFFAAVGMVVDATIDAVNQYSSDVAKAEASKSVAMKDIVYLGCKSMKTMVDAANRMVDKARLATSGLQTVYDTLDTSTFFDKICFVSTTTRNRRVIGNDTTDFHRKFSPITHLEFEVSNSLKEMFSFNGAGYNYYARTGNRNPVEVKDVSNGGTYVQAIDPFLQGRISTDWSRMFKCSKQSLELKITRASSDADKGKFLVDLQLASSNSHKEQLKAKGFVEVERPDAWTCSQCPKQKMVALMARYGEGAPITEIVALYHKGAFYTGGMAGMLNTLAGEKRVLKMSDFSPVLNFEGSLSGHDQKDYLHGCHFGYFGQHKFIELWVHKDPYIYPDH